MRKILAVLPVALAVLSACHGDATGPDTVPAKVVLTPATASLVAGATTQLSSLVLTASGKVLTDRAVTYSTDNAAVATVSASGLVTAVGPAGTANITASVDAIKSSPSSIVVTAAAARNIAKEADLPSSPEVASSNPVKVKVTDAFGNGVAGVSVAFAVEAGGGAVTPTTALTDASGVAETSFTLGTSVGVNSVSAMAASLASSVTFSTTSVAGPASAISKIGNDPGTVAAGTTFLDSVRAKVSDAYGNPKSGASVSFIVTAGGGSISPASALTDASGLAAAEFTTGKAIGVVNTAGAKLNGDAVVVFSTETTLPWSRVESGTIQYLSSVWGTSSSNVWAVGSGGIILHYDGTSWSSVPSGTTMGLASVWGTSASDVWAVGAGGAMVHYDGTNWSAVPSAPVDLWGVWSSSPSDIWVVSSRYGLPVQYTGPGSLPSDPGGIVFGPARAVWGTSPSDIWSTTTHGNIYRYDGSTWSAQAYGNLLGLQAVWGTSSSDVWAVGYNIQHYNGTTWTPSAASFSGLNDVSGSSERDVWAVGQNGMILHFDGSSWQKVSSGTTENLPGVWSNSTTDAWIVGPGGLILHGSPPQ
jgi:hypothetical protein